MHQSEIELDAIEVKSHLFLAFFRVFFNTSLCVHEKGVHDRVIMMFRILITIFRILYKNYDIQDALYDVRNIHMNTYNAIQGHTF